MIMVQDTDSVPRAVIDAIVAQFKHLMDEACDRWSLPKSDNPTRFTAWHDRETAYRTALELFADAGLAPKYARR
jgi:hypothetical protein